jgi:rRNA small subunit pseudouridine methyltransferase Nep1
VIIVAEAALELVPKEIQRHPSVRKEAMKRGKEKTGLLLDRSLHHSAMLNLENNEKRGRPDLVHIALLQITCAPIFLAGKIEAYLHTVNNEVIQFKTSVRIPKSYFRFQGLMEKVLSYEVGEGWDKNLISIKKMRLSDFVESLRVAKVVGFSRLGKRKQLEVIADENFAGGSSALIIGGFPKGTFSRETESVLAEKYSISKYSLDAHVVCARVLYEFEKRILD